MLDAKPDAVWVTSPTPYHKEQVLAVVERKFPVYMEKPPALDLESCKTMQDAFNRAGIIHCVGLQWRYRKHVDIIREELTANKPRLVVGRWNWDRNIYYKSLGREDLVRRMKQRYLR